MKFLYYLFILKYERENIKNIVEKILPKFLVIWMNQIFKNILFEYTHKKNNTKKVL